MIRKAKYEDYNTLSTFYCEFDNHGVNLFDSDPFVHLYVYEKNKNILGFISYSIAYDRAEINYIYVAVDSRKKGIASSLMETCIDDVIKHGCINITLEVSSQNIAGINLYKKYGFSQAAIRPKYYRGVDALLMMKELIK